MNSLPLANDGNTKSSLEDRVMSRINHTRPILQMIDDIKRHRTESALSPSEWMAKKSDRHDLATLDATSKDLIHQCAARVLEHFGTHKDVRLPQRLLDAVDETTKLSLSAWFSEFSSIRASDGKLLFDKTRLHRLGSAIKPRTGSSRSQRIRDPTRRSIFPQN